MESPNGLIWGSYFLIYINDASQILVCTKSRLYADDAVLYISDSEERNVHAGGQHDLLSLTERLTISSKMSKVLLFGMCNILKNASCLDIYIGNKKLQYVKVSSLIASLTLRLMHWNVLDKCLTCYMLSKIRNLITNKQAITIHKNKILPYFDYGDIF